MDFYQVSAGGGAVVVQGLRHFSLEEILESGQCFRWSRTESGSYEGIALGRFCRISQREDSLIFHGADEREFYQYWEPYFDLSRDYGALKNLFSSDPVMRKAMEFCPGMRVLRQDPWEALCSFILSQNNNIKRIKGLVQRLCELAGEQVPGGYAFPTPQALAACRAEDLVTVRSGFRAGYLLDAAARVASGEIDLPGVGAMPIQEARECLQTIRGVGVKVAECALLYGWGRMECFPVDVWINRALQEYYPEGFPEKFRPWAGIAQQYLFHYMRCGVRN